MEENRTYEQKAARLEEIVRKLENGESSLEDMMKLYQEGMALYKECSDVLEKYEHEISVLKAGAEEA